MENILEQNNSFVVISLYWSESSSLSTMSYGERIGVAAFEEETSSLITGSVPFSIIQDSILNDSSIDIMKQSIHPTLFLLHPKILSNTQLLNAIVQGADSSNEIPYQVMKSSAWNPTDGFNILSNMVSFRNEANRAQNLSDQRGYLKFSSLIPLEDKIVTSALAALLHHLQSTCFLLEDGKITISSIKPLQLVSTLRMDTATMAALQIFSEDLHPNVFKAGAGKSKEGY